MLQRQEVTGSASDVSSLILTSVLHADPCDSNKFSDLAPSFWFRPTKRRRPVISDDSTMESPLAKKVRKDRPSMPTGSVAVAANHSSTSDIPLFDNDYFTVRLVPNDDDGMTGMEIEVKPNGQQLPKAGQAKMMIIRCLVEDGEIDVTLGQIGSSKWISLGKHNLVSE